MGQSMEEVTWSKKYSVNIKEIDEQHQKILGIFNQLFDSFQHGQEDEILLQTITELIEYAKKHFKIEESYMVQFGYPDMESHVKEHQFYIDKVMGFHVDYMKNKSFLTIDILKFIKDWFVAHILNTDKRYSKLFNEKGLV